MVDAGGLAALLANENRRKLRLVELQRRIPILWRLSMRQKNRAASALCVETSLMSLQRHIRPALSISLKENWIF